MERYPRLTLALEDEALYGRFRVLEQSLVSCLDGKPRPTGSSLEILGVHCNLEPAGVVSLVLERNFRKSGAANSFGRIDLVIVPESFRRLGLARLLVFSGILYLLEKYGDRLYSISCLAAHPAIEKILSEVGFASRERPGCNYVHVELKLESVDRRPLIATLLEKTEAAARIAHFKFRKEHQPA